MNSDLFEVIFYIRLLPTFWQVTPFFSNHLKQIWAKIPLKPTLSLSIITIDTVSPKINIEHTYGGLEDHFPF